MMRIWQIKSAVKAEKKVFYGLRMRQVLFENLERLGFNSKECDFIVKSGELTHYVMFHPQGVIIDAIFRNKMLMDIVIK